MADSERFLSITDVSKQLDVPSHILRFWEKQFKDIKPITGKGGRRYYKSEDIRLIATIRDLLYKEGYTIKGVKKVLQTKNNPDGNYVAKVSDINESKNSDLEKAMALLIQAKMVLNGINNDD